MALQQLAVSDTAKIRFVSGQNADGKEKTSTISLGSDINAGVKNQDIYDVASALIECLDVKDQVQRIEKITTTEIKNVGDD